MSVTGLNIGQSGDSGTVRVIGNGTSGSARIDITKGWGLRNSMGGHGLLEIQNGGVIESHTQDIRLGNQGLEATPGTAITNIDGTGSILRTIQGSYGPESWQKSGGHIFVGVNGQSNSVVNITNRGLMEAVAPEEIYEESFDDARGVILIGTLADGGSQSIVNVDGSDSTMRAYTSLAVNAQSGSNSELNVTNGALVEAYGATDVNGDAPVDISSLEGTATARVSGAGSKIISNDIQVGGTEFVYGYTASGKPVGTIDVLGLIDSSGELVSGRQVTDQEGNPLYDLNNNPVLTTYYAPWDTVVPSTYLPGNELYAKETGSLLVENSASVDAPVINVSKNHPAAQAYNGQEAVLTVRNGGTITGDVNVYKDGVLNGDGGTIQGNVTVNGGTVAPGNSPGTLTIDGNADFLDGLLELEITSTAMDLLNITGDLTLGEDLMISLIFDFDPIDFILDLDDFFNVGGSLVLQNFNLENNLNFVGLTNSTNLTVNFGSDQKIFGNQTLPPSSVPEPASILLLGFGLLGIRLFKRYSV
ncbi:MAG: PEP-CTERM sorting domain-containing protein, partial [gamma proteobacterium symbiont of Bathyaustriella thionipta]|nr:PEP-CTERM sorting domain-containing protein [gamma proteobacterium symbiont of Bathyaustriella thionipta]